MRRFWLHWLTLVRMSIQALASTQLLAWMYSARSGWMTWNIWGDGQWARGAPSKDQGVIIVDAYMPRGCSERI